MSAPVVVGMDGSASSLDAVELAAGEARLRGCGLKVVHASIWPSSHLPLDPAGSDLRELVGRVVAVERARCAAPQVQATHVLVPGDPLTVLEDQSRTAALVVVGSRGLGGFAGMHLGSTAVHLAAHSHCPVIVVRRPAHRARGILLGVDGSPAGDAAVEFAFEEAALRGAALVALHAWSPGTAGVPALQDPTSTHASGPGAPERGEDHLVTEALAARRRRYPGVAVEHTVVRGDAREALIAASGRAALVVVGSRGHGAITGLLLGSVSRAVLHRAHCPVAVVRGPGARQ